MEAFGDRRVWWRYLGNRYQQARAGGYLWAPGDPEHPLRRVRSGDWVVHEYRRRIVAVSRVLTSPTLTPSDAAGHQGGWRVRVEYIDLNVPVPFEDLRDQLREV